MLKIVGVDRLGDVENEAILLQNLGALTIDLRGHSVAIDTPEGVKIWHVFHCPIRVRARGYVLLRTRVGVPCSGRTRDGHEIFADFANSSESLETYGESNLYVLSPGTPHALKVNRLVNHR